MPCGDREINVTRKLTFASSKRHIGNGIRTQRQNWTWSVLQGSVRSQGSVKSAGGGVQAVREPLEADSAPKHTPARPGNVRVCENEDGFDDG